MQHRWGSLEPKITDPFDPVRVYSEKCPDLLVYYEAESYDPFTMQWNKIPRTDATIVFDPNLRSFTLDKCGPETGLMDFECELPPYTKIEDIRIVVIILDKEMTSAVVDFISIHGPNCEHAEVYVQEKLHDITYELSTNPSSELMTPLFYQTDFQCGMYCQLFETGVIPQGYSSPTIVHFDNSLGQITISSDDLSLH